MDQVKGWSFERSNTGWSFERGTSERVDNQGWVITEPTDNAEFVCQDHEYSTGAVPVQQACEDARAHFAEQHPGETNPFSEAS